VTGLKDNADFRVVRKLRVPTNRNILKDEIIRFTGFYAPQDCPHVLRRRIEVLDKEKEEVIVLLANHLTFGSTTISAIYKDRWQIDVFFKILKQNLRVKMFVGSSANALKVQIWTAVRKYLNLAAMRMEVRSLLSAALSACSGKQGKALRPFSMKLPFST